MNLNSFKIERCAKLVLNTQLFYPNGAGNNSGVGAMDPTQGNANGPRLNFTFTNLNWRVILGEMFDEYETFNLILITADWLVTGGTPFGLYNRSSYMQLVGLDWLNQTYDVYKKAMSNSCVIHLSGNQKPVYNTCTFRRPAGNGIGDLSFTVLNSWDNSQNALGDRPFTYQYLFNIYGVDKVNK